jgi:hypothetical protein
MSTVNTRILNRLSPDKSDVGQVGLDDHGRNVGQWNDADTEHACTTVLMKPLGNDSLRMADTQTWTREDPGKKRPKPDTSAAPHELRMEDTGKIHAPARKSKVRNRFGKNTDVGGGFNPYG